MNSKPSDQKWETHCHTVYSNKSGLRTLDALDPPDRIVRAAIQRGLRGIVVTDHDNVKGGLVARKLFPDPERIIVIPGAEVSTISGHILALGIVENVPSGRTIEETVDRIHDLGGIAVASHPFSTSARSVGEKCLSADAVEVFNSTIKPSANARAMHLAHTHHKPETAGSDAHWARGVGNAGIVCGDPITDIPRGRVSIFSRYAGRLHLSYLMGMRFLKRYEQLFIRGSSG